MPYHNRVYSVDEYFFDKIDTQEKAYWLGYLAGDGHIDEKRGLISLHCKYDDREILLKFKEHLSAEHAIKKSKNGGYPSVYLRITCKRLCDRLVQLGLDSTKTKKCFIPDMSDHLKRHFIRGLFDADGCVTHGTLASGYKHRKVNFVGNKWLLGQVRELLNDIVTKPNRKLYNQKSIYALEYRSKYDMPIIYDYLYQGAVIYLSRKKQKFEEVIT